MKQRFYSNGKLLLTGEYVVLDGALALAIPTQMGQSLSVRSIEEEILVWESLDANDEVWFSACFQLTTLLPVNEVSEEKAEARADQLSLILKKARQLNASFLATNQGYFVSTRLDFPGDWGLGSSSTLLNNIAQWAGVDAFELLKESFGGSGYDIAAAQNDSPVLYSHGSTGPNVEPVELPWDFTDRLFFVHLNQKQDSREGIARYEAQLAQNSINTGPISEITKKMVQCRTLDRFRELLELHEDLIAAIVDLPPVKDRLFPDYQGTVKSLGAWGGDFVLATGNKADHEYFKKKGYHTIIPFIEMIK